MKNIFIKILLLFSLAGFIGFCIISNEEGEYRKYWDSSIPLVIQLNDETPSEYDPVVEQAIGQWNDIEGCYFEFELGPRVSNNSASQDNVNLLYFDSKNDNFAEGTNTIAFSRTFTLDIGGYHAIESDYIYNAAGYPPSITGETDKMDLFAITMHEVGHHMGLSHAGPDGNSNGSGSAGCGPSLPDAVMYYAVSFGPQPHELTLDDQMSAIAMYPNFVLEADVRDASTGDKLEGVLLDLSEGVYGTLIQPLEAIEYSYVNNAGDTVYYNYYLTPGLVRNDFYTDASNDVVVAINKRTFDYRFEKYGYFGSDLQSYAFEEPGGPGNTQYADMSVNLEPKQLLNFNIVLKDKDSGEPVTGEVDIFWKVDNSLVSTFETGENGSATVELFEQDSYDILVRSNPPYQREYLIEDVFVESDADDIVLELEKTNILFVNSSPVAEDSAFTGYLESLENLGVEYSYWDGVNRGELSQQSFYSDFDGKFTIVWVTAGDSTAGYGLTSDDNDLMVDHLEAGNNLILLGSNISEFAAQDDSILAKYGGVKFRENSDDIRMKGFKDDILGDGFAKAFQGKSKDLMDLTENPIGNVYRSFYLGTTNIDTANIIGVRSEGIDSDWKFIFFSSPINEMVSTFRDTIIARMLSYAAGPGSVTGIDKGTDELARNFNLSQNYPNPFNPSTTIKFNLPVPGNIKLTVYNILGEQIDLLKEGEISAGEHSIKWNAGLSNISSGIYFYRIDFQGNNGRNFSETKKMMLIK